jgi:uncharacterized RDD family membrane protein YckC
MADYPLICRQMNNTESLLFTDTGNPVIYAGFGKRLMAYLVDAAIVIPFCLVVHWLVKDDNAQSLIITIFIIAYYDLMESGPYQATLGKKLMGLKITTVKGYPITKKTSAFRLILKVLLSFLLMAGYLPALWTKRKQTAYDLIVGTVVIESK